MSESSRRAAAAKALLLLLARLGIAGLFLYAGVMKALDPAAFAQEIANFRILPEPLIGPLALFLPAIEVFAGLALLLPGYRAGGALLTGAMLLGFSIAMAQARMRGIDAECGCFGASSASQVSWEKVAQDLALAMLSFWILREELPKLRATAASPAPEQA